MTEENPKPLNLIREDDLLEYKCPKILEGGEPSNKR